MMYGNIKIQSHYVQEFKGNGNKCYILIKFQSKKKKNNKCMSNSPDEFAPMTGLCQPHNT